MTTTHMAWPVTLPAGQEEGAYDEDVFAAARQFAQGVLWALTGRRFGIALTTGEAYRFDSANGDECYGPWLDRDGDWVNGPRTKYAPITLEHQPVREIVEVRVDGGAIPSTTYVLEGAMLRRLDVPWPASFHDQGPRIEVDYRWGAGFPVGAAAAMAELTLEAIEAMTPGRNCRLPVPLLNAARTSVARQGVTTDVERVAGSIGLPLCDALIATVNPNRMVERSRVFSPDVGMRS